MADQFASESRSRFDVVFDGIERVGNRLPHPFMLFVYLLVTVAVVSTVVAAFDITVLVPGTDDPVPVRGVFTGQGMVYLLTHFVDNFIGFAPLGNVLAMLIAVGVAERTGLLETGVRTAFARAPARLLPYAVAFVAFQGHVMSDPSIIIIPPLAALVFRAAGREPLAGLIGGFACVTGGYGAGILIGSLDALLAGITQEVATIVPVAAPVNVNIIMNYFFTAASGLVLPLVGGFLIDRVLEPRLRRHGAETSEQRGEAAKETAPGHDPTQEVDTSLTQLQRRGLRVALLVLAVYIAGVLAAWLIPSSALRGEGGSLVPSPFLDGIIPLLVGAFVVAGVGYGVASGTLTKAQDVPGMMSESVRNLAGYIVLIFAIGQVIALFEWSHLGTLVAVKSAELLQAAHLTGFGAIVVLILIASLFNLFIISGSALWSLLAPVMIPAFMLLGYEPGFIQAAYRIGDSATQIITPMNPYMYVLLGYVQMYRAKMQLGTLLSHLSIFVIPFWIVWVAVLAIFYFFGLPVGPGTGVRLG